MPINGDPDGIGSASCLLVDDLVPVGLDLALGDILEILLPAIARQYIIKGTSRDQPWRGDVRGHIGDFSVCVPSADTGVEQDLK